MSLPKFTGGYTPEVHGEYDHKKTYPLYDPLTGAHIGDEVYGERHFFSDDADKPYGSYDWFYSQLSKIEKGGKTPGTMSATALFNSVAGHAYAHHNSMDREIYAMVKDYLRGYQKAKAYSENKDKVRKSVVNAIASAVQSGYPQPKTKEDVEKAINDLWPSVSSAIQAGGGRLMSHTPGWAFSDVVDITTDDSQKVTGSSADAVLSEIASALSAKPAQTPAPATPVAPAGGIPTEVQTYIDTRRPSSVYQVLNHFKKRYAPGTSEYRQVTSVARSLMKEGVGSAESHNLRLGLEEVNAVDYKITKDVVQALVETEDAGEILLWSINVTDENRNPSVLDVPEENPENWGWAYAERHGMVNAIGLFHVSALKKQSGDKPVKGNTKVYTDLAVVQDRFRSSVDAEDYDLVIVLDLRTNRIVWEYSRGKKSSVKENIGKETSSAFRETLRKDTYSTFPDPAGLIMEWDSDGVTAVYEDSDGMTTPLFEIQGDRVGPNLVELDTGEFLELYNNEQAIALAESAGLFKPVTLYRLVVNERRRPYAEGATWYTSRSLAESVATRAFRELEDHPGNSVELRRWTAWGETRVSYKEILK